MLEHGLDPDDNDVTRGHAPSPAAAPGVATRKLKLQFDRGPAEPTSMYLLRGLRAHLPDDRGQRSDAPEEIGMKPKLEALEPTCSLTSTRSLYEVGGGRWSVKRSWLRSQSRRLRSSIRIAFAVAAAAGVVSSSVAAARGSDQDDASRAAATSAEAHATAAGFFRSINERR